LPLFGLFRRLLAVRWANALGLSLRANSTMTEFQCWFCGQGISRADAGAVIITVQSLWRWDAGSRSDSDPLQSVYAHSTCAKERLRGETMSLEPSIFGEED
jgi:hypothetical protein